MSKKVDRTTRQWIRNASDELAAQNGCRFDEERGRFVVDWLETYLRLYEGEWADEPFTCHDWQLEATMRMFGWVRNSERWGREVRRFRRASIYIPKKNKKSPTLAAWGLYLFAGDGEQGQKVFLCAKDGRQARDIAGKHAIEMCLASPVLMDECSINRTLMQITHEPTRSIMVPLSSSDASSQKSKEGINGSVLVDETHVVDGRFMAIVERAGISRSEPLQIEVSTAGNNPDGYGKMQFDYGRRVEAGEVEDERLFYLEYAASQNLKETELDKDPVKFGKEANPAWGHTIGEEEYLDDYRTSKGKGPAKLREFMMYRLNVWQQSSNPWLPADHWDRCRDVYGEEDFAGEYCTAGLDLSRTRDMTSLVLSFRRDDHFWLLPYFWLPRSRMEELAVKVPAMVDWSERGFLRLCRGDTIDQDDIYEEMERLDELFRIAYVAYDAKYAEELTKRAEDKLRIERVEYPQTADRMAGPTEAFEGMVLSGELKHNGHPVLTWQAGHVEIKQRGRHKIISKPEFGRHLTIDGIASGIMAIDVAVKNPIDSGPVFTVG